jgi:hypothetical protein
MAGARVMSPRIGVSDPVRRPLGFDGADDLHRAGELLRAASYSEEGLREALDKPDLVDMAPLEEPRAVRRTRAGTPLDTLIRLFFLGMPVALDAARRALHPMSVEDWSRAGLLVVRDAQVAPLVKLAPYRGLLLASDLRARLASSGSDDFVLGASKSSTLLDHVSLKRRVGRTLDLGTGCGVLALLASARSERVWATDKNPRAVAFAEFNAQLNGIANVECSAGDLFDPVASRRFDLVLSNPPYVIAPQARYLFSDSGVRGDEFCRRLVRRAPSFLEDGGYCQMVANWAHTARQSWQDPLAEWFEDTGCDVLVWGADTQDASGYATTWIQQVEPAYHGRFPELHEAWMGYFDREGIEAVTYGVITLRRTSARRNWIRYVKVPTGSAAPTGDHILDRFAAQDFLEATVDDRQLLDQWFRLAPDVRLEQHYAPKDDGFAAVATRLHLAREPAYYSMEIDPTVTTLIMFHGGKRRLRDVFDGMAAAMRVDLDQLVAGGLPVVRRLVQNGYLLPTAADD